MDNAMTVTCRCSIKETKTLFLLLVVGTTHLPLLCLCLWTCAVESKAGLTIQGPKRNANFLKLYEVFSSLFVKPNNTASLLPGDLQQPGCRGEWIAEGNFMSFNSRPEHHSPMKDNWWVKSPGSCWRVINGDRYTTWETGWEGKKIIYKRIVNSCTYC